MRTLPDYAPTWIEDEYGDTAWIVYDQTEGFQPAYAVIRADDAEGAVEGAFCVAGERLSDASDALVVEPLPMLALLDIFDAYCSAAIWTEADRGAGSPGGAETIDDFDSESLAEAREEVLDFVTESLAALTASKLEAAQIGHDFWLTRNGHGAGFWDRGLGWIGDLLTAACKPYGESYLSVGDNGRLYFEPSEIQRRAVNAAMGPTIVEIPGTFTATYERGRITVLTFMPSGSDAGYFGPSAVPVSGPSLFDLDIENTRGAFWRAMQSALGVVDIDWQE